MAKRYSLGKGLRRRGRRMKAWAPAPALTAPSSPESDAASLPLPPAETLAHPASSELPESTELSVAGNTGLSVKKDNPYKLPAKSKLKKTVMRILVLRTKGYALADIGEMLGLSPHTIRGYLYKAGRNGWLEDLDDPRDRIEHDILHKVVRNMSDALDSADESRRDDMTIKIAQGTVFKTFDQQANQAPPIMTLAVKIEQAEGATTTVRAGAVVGRPAFVEGDVVG